jgi:hypothetical protein
VDLEAVAVLNASRSRDSQTPPSGTQRLFEALDGSALRVGDVEWRLQVYGVIEAGNRRWVQLTLDGVAHQVLTLKLEKTHGPRYAVSALARWLSDPTAETQDVLPRVA